MKSRMICVLLVVLLGASMAACSDGNNSSGTDIPAISASPSPEVKREEPKSETPVDEHPALGAYQAVLQGNAGFFSTDHGKNISLNDFLTDKELYGVAFKAARFSVLDLDGDSEPEVVVELTVEDAPEFYEVLHYMDGAVSGYNITARGMGGLKADGTFQYSNGAADNGYGTLKFRTNAYDIDILGYMESSQNDNGMSIACFVEDQPVTEEAYQSFMQEQDGKKDAVWHALSQENIEAALSVNP